MVDREQFAILYREFLFRMVDRDLLSVHADGDVSKLLGRLAAFLVWISIPFGGMAYVVAQGDTLAPVHRIIATTMLVASVFCVLAWDALLPDRSDVFILMPLGVNAVTIVAARVASLLAALGTAVLVFNAFPGLLFPFALVPSGLNLLEVVFSVHLYRAIVAYWLTVFLAGGFVVLAVILIQALVAQLPREAALRLSSFFQIAVFCIALAVYFLQPSAGSAEQFGRPEVSERLSRFPSYWFLGVFHGLNGPPGGPADAVLKVLAKRGWLALTVVAAGAAAVLAHACVRALRKVAEQPDIAPKRNRHRLSWSWGASPRAAILQWTLRTLFRSRQHRVLISFYAGLGFAAIILFLQARRVQILAAATSADFRPDLNIPLICASFMMLISWLVGVRAAFAIPIAVRANWIFRVTLTDGPAEPLKATRSSLLIAGLLPVWSAAAVSFLWLWPAPKAVQHLLILALVGVTLAACRLRGFHKVPFTCAYLPGTSHMHITLALCVLLGLNLLFWSANLVQQALLDSMLYLQVAGVLAVAAGACWWWLRSEELPEVLDFEEPSPAAVTTLGLNRDGYSGR